MFWRLSEAAAPKYYPHRNFYFLPKASFASRTILNTITKYPQNFLMWVRMAVFFEEITLKYSKEYFKNAQSQALEENFVSAHRLYMIEEARHVRMDSHLIETFYSAQPPWKGKLAVLMMRKVIKDFASPRRMAFAIAKELTSEFPDSTKSIQNMLRELPILNNNQDF